MKYFTKACLLLAMLFVSAAAMAQYTVSGDVKSESGEPLIGVSIIVKGSTSGTVTDFNGNFTINVKPDPAILEFSYTGFKSKDAEVSSAKNSLNVTLEEDVANLEEVVVTGLATSIKRTNLANAVEQINAKELTGVTPQQTMDGALYGKFKGANISSNSGSPGGGISIKLRGITSLTANSQPLFIVDGVYVDNSAVKAGFDVVSKSQAGGSQSIQDDPSNRIADIPLDDIETIEILKGASAAAIYGSRAGAGVVIITTKRGKAGKTRVNLTQSVGFNTLLNPLGQRTFDAQKVEASFGADEVPVFQAAQSNGEIFDYEKELYGNTGAISNTNVSMSGGSDKTQFYGGFSYRDEEGVVLGTGYRKASARLNLDHELFDFFDIKLSSVYINSSADRGYFNNDNSGTTLGISYVSTPPWAKLFADANGNYPNNPYAGGNFLQSANQVTNNESVDRFIVGGIGEARLLTTDNNALRLIIRGGTDYYTLGTKAIFPRTLQFQKDGNGTDGAAIVGNTLNTNSNFATFLVHSLFTDSGISFTTQAGVTAENFNQNTVRTTATFLVGSQTNLDQASSIVADQNRVIQKDRGFFVQEEVNFQDKVIATLGLRGDKSSNNGDPNQLYYYPKASLALNLHEFGFWSQGNINQLKLRGAFGQSGNFPVFGAIYNSLSATIIDSRTGSLINSRRGNKDLGPERQTEFEVGFDIGILNSKLVLDATYYIKNIDDLVLDVNTPTSSGFSRQWTNVGSLGNQGVEIGLTANPYSSRTFSWLSRTAFWLNRAEVTTLTVPAYNIGAFGATLGTYRIEEGKSPTQLVGITDNPNAEGGLEVFGDATPDFQMSFLNAFNFGRLEFSFLIHWKAGGENVNLSTLLSDLSGTSPDYDDVTLDPSGQMSNGDYRQAQLGVTAGPWVEDASYMRVREIGLSYSIPRGLLGDIADLKIGLSGRNLINVFDYNSYDPEVSNFGSNAISSAVEVTPFPSAKTFYFNLSATF